MKLFMQGMRRSGTTIIYDILSQDPRLDLFYEPFSAGREGALGGGSGIQEVDLMDKVRQVREDFLASSDLDVDPTLLNYGAPREPSLELEKDLPDYCREYVRYMLSLNEHSVFKFTRLYCKVHELKKLAPEGKFLLLLRHPQEVVASYMYGRDQRRLEKFPDREVFFNTCNISNPWKSKDFFEAIIKEKGLTHLEDIPNWMRYLVVWKYTFDCSYSGGLGSFGDSFNMLKHEELVANPEATVRRVYDFMEVSPSDEAIQWAVDNVRANPKECYHDDLRWIDAFKILELTSSLENAGYGMTSSDFSQGREQR